jgi:hypothetical protein
MSFRLVWGLWFANSWLSLDTLCKSHLSEKGWTIFNIVFIVFSHFYGSELHQGWSWGKVGVVYRHAHESFILTLRYLSRDNSLLIVLQYIDPVLHITLSQALVCVFYSLKTKALYIYQFSKYLMFINNTPTTSNGNASNRYVWNSSILYIIIIHAIRYCIFTADLESLQIQGITWNNFLYPL